MRIFYSLLALVAFSVLKSSIALVESNLGTRSTLLEPVLDSIARSEGTTRRLALAAAFGLVSTVLQVEAANAFDNKISNKFDDRPKRRGPKVSVAIHLTAFDF